jgi:hypothetical protein
MQLVIPSQFWNTYFEMDQKLPEYEASHSRRQYSSTTKLIYISATPLPPLQQNLLGQFLCEILQFNREGYSNGPISRKPTKQTGAAHINTITTSPPSVS